MRPILASIFTLLLLADIAIGQTNATPIKNPTLSGTLTVSGVSNKSTVRSDLGLAVGTDVQAQNATLQTIATGAGVPFSLLQSKPVTLSGYGITDAQPLDSDLTAVAALSTTSFGRGFLALSDGAATRTYAGLQIGTDVQAQNSTLQAIATGPTLLRKWRFARGAVKSGTSKARIVCVGDSTTAGYGANAGSGYTGAKARAYPAKLAAELTARGIPAMDASFMGANQNAVSTNSYDPRITLGAGWSVESTYNTVGEFGFKSTTNGAVFSFTPTQSFNAIDVVWGNYTGNGGFTVNVDGGSTLATATPSSGVGVIATVSGTCTLATHTINLTTSSSTYTYVVGVVASNTSSRSVDVINAGADAALLAGVARSDDWFTSQNALTALGADLYIVDIGINDWNGGTNSGTWTTAFTTFITALRAVGDVIIVVPNPITGTPSNQAAIIAAMKAQATSSGCVLVSLYDRFINYSTAVSDGFLYDTLHPSVIGYQDFATMLAEVLAQ